MAAGGSTGPNRGGYFSLTFATGALASASSGAGITIGAWTVPTGARLHIYDVQAFCDFSGSLGMAAGVGRINVLAGSTSVLSSEISLASGSSVAGTLTAGTVVVTSGTTLTATGQGGLNVGGAGGANWAQNVQVRVLCGLAQHPNSVFGNFGYANPTSQPNFGP